MTVAGAYSSGLNPLYIAGFGTKALFDGHDSSSHLGLWVTDGTAAGTSELTVAGAYSGGLFSGFQLVFDVGPEFTVLGSRALFQGRDASGNFNLWVTDGTAAGTSKLQVAGAYSGGLFFHVNGNTIINPDFTVLGNKALFLGDDANGAFNLWVTDGTSAGTSEIPAAGAYPGGLFYYQSTDGPDFTVLGSRAVFVGTDANTHGEGSLWVTDGTSAGTSELIVAGANVNGLDPRGPFAILGGKALFLGFGQNGSGLWVTDGTSAGTSELTAGVSPQELTVFGSKALFRDGSGLWVTDGTSAGTTKLTVAGAYPSGLSPQGFTVLGNKVLFEGEDAGGHFNLWVTDGTSAGTNELTVAGTPSGGLSPQEITALGEEALFAGERSSIFTDLWVTDGTSAGTIKLTVAGAYSGGLTPSDITVLATSSKPISPTRKRLQR